MDIFKLIMQRFLKLLTFKVSSQLFHSSLSSNHVRASSCGVFGNISPETVITASKTSRRRPVGDVQSYAVGAGDSVGDTDGDFVGESVVGYEVGESDGDEVGDAVGDDVGGAVGDDVGDAVGDDVGVAVGDDVGVAVGNLVGDAVGDKVGDKVGAGVLPSHALLGAFVDLVDLFGLLLELHFGVFVAFGDFVALSDFCALPTAIFCTRSFTYSVASSNGFKSRLLLKLYSCLLSFANATCMHKSSKVTNCKLCFIVNDLKCQLVMYFHEISQLKNGRFIALWKTDTGIIVK